MWDTAYEHGNELIVRQKIGGREAPLLAELRLVNAATAEEEFAKESGLPIVRINLVNVPPPSMIDD